MRYGFNVFHPERATKEPSTPSWMLEWASRWHALKSKTRACFLELCEKHTPRANPQRGLLASRLPAAPLEELNQAGLVAFLEPGSPGVKNRQVIVAGQAVPFAQRLLDINRIHPLRNTTPYQAETYYYQAYPGEPFYALAQRVLESSGLPAGYRNQAVDQLTHHSQWLAWVVKTLKDPLAQPILDAVEQAGGRMAMGEMAQHFPGLQASEVWATLDNLVRYRALFEDLDPQTRDLEVGLRQSVLEGLRRSRQPRQRAELTPCPAPPELGPPEGALLGDLRNFLLELATTPARLKQGTWDLFQKEHARFEASLAPLPPFYGTPQTREPANRIAQSVNWAQHLGLVKRVRLDSGVGLQLTPTGQRWLAYPLEKQATFFYDHLRQPSQQEDPYASYGFNDSLFLGSSVVAVETKKGNSFYFDRLKPEERQRLREAVYRAFQELEPGTFYRREQFLAHAVFGQDNPVLLGKDPKKVYVVAAHHPVLPLEDALEDAGRELLAEVLDNRLIPLGAVQLGHEADGTLVLARQPRLDVYFGHAAAEVEPTPAETGTRVIVQPDFSVLVIGLDPAPAVELAPFSERRRGQTGQGSLEFKLTRESVIRAVTNGLKGEEILARLHRLSSTPLPGNVEHEVREWAGWVRDISVAPVSLLRCPDAATADRLTAALGKRAERVNDTLVALAGEPLTAADRKRLLTQGLNLHAEEGAPRTSKGKSKRKRR